jgi:hypothetical protein
VRRLLIAVVVVAVAAGGGIYALTGAKSGASKVAFDDVAAAAGRTMQIRSERMSMDMTVTASGQTVHMTGTGVMNNVTRLGQLTMHLDRPREMKVEEFVDTSGGGMVAYVKAPGAEGSTSPP